MVGTKASKYAIGFLIAVAVIVGVIFAEIFHSVFDKASQVDTSPDVIVLDEGRIVAARAYYVNKLSAKDVENEKLRAALKELKQNPEVITKFVVTAKAQRETLPLENDEDYFRFHGELRGGYDG
ncbi:unnamed protein product, partial [marine sediment metagenome]